MMIRILNGRSGVSVSACVLIAGLAGSALPAKGQISASPKSIKWNSGLTESIQVMNPTQATNELNRLSQHAPKSHIIVHFQNALTKADHEQLAANGLFLQSPLGGHSYFATVIEGVNSTEIVRTGAISVTQITRNHKLHQDLAQGLIHPWMVRTNAAAGNIELQEMLDSGLVLSEEFIDRGLDPMIAVLVMFHKDEAYRAESKRLAKSLGAQVTSEVYSINTVTMHIPLSKVADLAADDSVQWVEPPLPMMGSVNAENRERAGVNIVSDSPYNLDGSGVTAMVFDSGRVWPHSDFESRLTIGASDVDGFSGHSTHVAGTIGGAGIIESQHQGMAPGVSLISYGFDVEGGLQAGFLYSEPGDIEADYSEAISLYGIDIANNSIGTNIEANGYPCEWTGNYGITSALIDSIVYGALGDSVPIIWANGNERSRIRCLGDDHGNHGEFYSTAPPACAKNSIAVGSVDADTDLISYFSSWGPTDDGRIKPDISGPGCESEDGVGVTSTYFQDTYATTCGTSMAAPTVTGATALVIQQHRISNPGSDDLMNATLKALLANTAVDRGEVGPDYAYGYGSFRVDAAVDAVIAGQTLEGSVGQSGVYRFEVEVAPGESELKVTMAWDDVPGTPNIGNVLINDLDLRIIDTTGAVYMPWTLDPSNPSAPAVQTNNDSINNIEQVLISNPVPGVYTVEITGTNIASGGVQSFGAVTNTTLLDCTSAGFISFDSSISECTGNSQVRVADCDLNTSDSIVETVDVLLTSDSQPGGAVITLTETTPDSAVFTAIFTKGSSGTPDILVIEGDTITATYTDADNGTGTSIDNTASMTTDCTPAIVIANRVGDIWYNEVTVSIDSDELTHCRVLYGEAGGAMTESTNSVSYFNSLHAVTLNGLTELTDYVYAIELIDTAGAVTLDDNNGAMYSFQTIEGPVNVFEFLVDDTDPSWERTGDWEFGNPSGEMKNPSEAVTGENIFGYDLDDWYPWHMEEEYLTTDVMDFTGIYEVRLDFERWLGIAINAFSHAAIEARAGGGEWVTIWMHGDPPHGGGRMSPTEWDHVQYELFEIADNQPDFQLRWVMGEASIHSDECGWNIDDIVFTGVIPPAICPVDLNSDGDLNFFDISAFLNAFSIQDPIADFSGDGELNFFDISAFLNQFAAGCP